MRKIVLIATLFFVSCNNNTKILLASSGNLNEISVVVEDQLWEGDVGKALKKTLSRPIYGLPQEEPLFKLRKIPPRVFSGFVTKSRTIIIIERNKQKHTRLLLNKYASPQTVIVVSGMTSGEIISELKKYSSKIINTIKSAEIKEKQRRIRKSLNNSQVLDSMFKIKLDFPSIYRVAAAERGFVWLRKDTKSGSVNLTIFQTPLKTNKLNTEQIILIRDSVSKQKIPGPAQGTYMSTETQYKSVLKSTKISKYKGLEIRGLWEVKKQFMGGPFINFSIVDSINNRILFFDGFVYSPATKKASYIFEIEAIIKSLKFLK